MNLIEFTWINLNFLGLPEFTLLYLNIPKLTWLYLPLLDFTWLYLTWIYMKLPKFNRIYLNFSKFPLIHLKGCLPEGFCTVRFPSSSIMGPSQITELVPYWDGTSFNQRSVGLQLCQKPLCTQQPFPETSKQWRGG